MARTPLLLLILLPAACGPVTRPPKAGDAMLEEERRLQQGLAVRSWAKNLRRLDRIAYPLLVAAASECPDLRHARPGFRAIQAETFPKELRDTAREIVSGGSERSVILSVPETAPSAAAGLQPGDRLLALNSAEIPPGERAFKKLQKQLAKLPAESPVTLEVERAAETVEIEYQPETGCGYRIIYLNEADAVNAYTTGTEIAVTRGMMRFAEDDLELALVVAHEIAHNTMGHIKKKMGNVLLGRMVDILIAGAIGVDLGLFGNIASLAFSQEFEAEADYVGLYLLSRTDYELEGVADFWRRMSVEHAGNIDIGTTHPTSPERFLAISETAKEIHWKQQHNLPLTPELK